MISKEQLLEYEDIEYENNDSLNARERHKRNRKNERLLCNFRINAKDTNQKFTQITELNVKTKELLKIP